MLVMLVCLGAPGGRVLKRRGPDAADARLSGGCCTVVLKRKGSDAHDAGLLGCSGWCCGNGGALMLLMHAFRGCRAETEGL